MFFSEAPAFPNDLPPSTNHGASAKRNAFANKTYSSSEQAQCVVLFIIHLMKTGKWNKPTTRTWLCGLGPSLGSGCVLSSCCNHCYCGWGALIYVTSLVRFVLCLFSFFNNKICSKEFAFRLTLCAKYFLFTFLLFEDYGDIIFNFLLYVTALQNQVAH